MTKAEKVQFVIDILQKTYPKIPIPLDHKDPYTLINCGVTFSSMYRCSCK